MPIYTSRENTHAPLSSTLKDSQKIHDFTNVNNIVSLLKTSSL